ncbi:MAG TPA: tetratricopeptide repeat protein [Gemmataceae bacterium]|jgi:tetratricopeptide (TPR) repeat protein|nr:tetratricopeptide repeat protein [Gemmataceae bacterium]
MEAEAASDKPIDPRAAAREWNALGCKAASEGRCRDAIAAFERAITADANDPDLFNNRGYARAALHDHAAAIADFDAALQLRPNFAAALNNRGLARLALCEYPAAAVDFDRALELEPDFVLASESRSLSRRRRRTRAGHRVL